MPWLLFDVYLLFPVFLLVLFRISGLMMAAPVFSSAALPTQFKIGLALAMAMAVFPFSVEHVPTEVTVAGAISGLLGELAIGLFIGLAMTMPLLAVQLAGKYISYQAGLAMGRAFNPMMETTTTTISQLYFYIAMMIFLLVGGDRALIRSLLDSFETVPVLSFSVTEDTTLLLTDMLMASYGMSVRLAGPTLLALMLTFMTLGFISRTVPQLNILTIGFPIKIILALVMVGLTLMELETVLLDAMTYCLDALRSGLDLPLLS